MVAGAINVCKWKFENKRVKASEDELIFWIRQKKEFTRGSLEKSTGLTLGQAEWWIKEFRKKGVIKRTSKFEYRLGRGNRQVIYRYVGKD